MMELHSVVSSERTGGIGHKLKYRKIRLTIPQLILADPALSRGAGPDNPQRNL